MYGEALGRESLEGHQVFLYKRSLPNGGCRFVAETEFGQGDRVLLDHWNLAGLHKMLKEVIPLMELARQWH